MNFNVGTFLTKRAQRNPSKPAIISESSAFSFRELNERSNRWADAFGDSHLKKGERVGILLQNRNEFLEAFFGLAKIGAVLVPLNWRLAPPELEYICGDSGLTRLIFSIEFRETIETIKSGLGVQDYIGVGSQTPSWVKDSEFVSKYGCAEPKLAGGGYDPAAILYTSGTTEHSTGHPLGVVRDHLSFLWLSTGLVATLDFRPEDRILVVPPLCYGWGLNCVINAVHMGCTTILMRTFDALQVLKTIQEQKVDTFLAVPKMLQQMTLVPNFEKYLGGLRTLETSEGVPRQLLEKSMPRSIIVRSGYGLTEAGYVTITSGPDIVEKPDSVGHPLFCTEVRVVNEDRFDLPPGEVGEILVKGPAVTKEYWANPEATEEAIRDGWLHTGDLGKLDEDGHVYVIGRIKDIIRSGGESVSPMEVENVLYQHPKVLEVGVLGQPDMVWGERVCAIVKPREGASLTLEDVVAFCHGKLAHFKIPKEVILTNAPLLRNPNGKLLRKGLRERLHLDGNDSSGPNESTRPKSLDHH